jgi:DUF4097 and DUF4098 domain-containing protein YvlB
MTTPTDAPITGPQVFAVDGPARVHVETGGGDIRVDAVPGATTVTVHLLHRPSEEELAARTQVRHVGSTVEVLVPRGPVGGLVGLLSRTGSVGVRLEVPAGSTADLSTRSGDITVTGTLGGLESASGSGDVAVRDVSGDVTMTTGSGDMTLGDVGGRARLRSGSGDLRVGRVGGAFEAVTGSGDVDTGEVAGPVQARSGSGDVTLGGTAADVVVGTASGEVRLGGAGSGEVEVKTASGDVVVAVPQGTAAYLDCSSVSGRLRSDLAATDAPTGDVRRLSVRVRTVSGDVTVRRP